MDMKRGILAIGCAVAFAVVPLVVAAPAAAKCPWGTSERFPGVCTSGMSNGVQPQAVLPPQASPPGANVVINPNGFSSVNGIPCTPEHYSTCIAMQQSQG